ncbi:MAG: hypothetical protein ACRDQ4_12990 [Pseudonocardiaceae bacterium]
MTPLDQETTSYLRHHLTLALRALVAAFIADMSVRWLNSTISREPVPKV